MVTQQQSHLAGIRTTDIVVGVDGSPSAQAALRWALTQAKATGARVQAVAAWEFPVTASWGVALPHEDLAASAGKALSEAVQEALGFDQPEVEVLESVMPGHPAQVLIDASAHAGLLVVGSRGLGSFAGTLLGSVSQHCAQHSRCPVVVVRGKS